MSDAMEHEDGVPPLFWTATVPQGLSIEVQTLVIVEQAIKRIRYSDGDAERRAHKRVLTYLLDRVDDPGSF